MNRRTIVSVTVSTGLLWTSTACGPPRAAATPASPPAANRSTAGDAQAAASLDAHALAALYQRRSAQTRAEFDTLSDHEAAVRQCELVLLGELAEAVDARRVHAVRVPADRVISRLRFDANGAVTSYRHVLWWAEQRWMIDLHPADAPEFFRQWETLRAEPHATRGT